MWRIRNNKMAKTKIEKPWYKRWWAIILFILVGLMIIGALFGEDTSPSDKSYNSIADSSNEKTPCEILIESQLPNIIKFSDSYIPLTSWNDGTNITTLKDIREVDGDGFLTEVKTGYFSFYKGENPG